MISISREEVLHIASLSKIEVSEEEIPQLIKDLQEVLSYAARVQEVAANIPETSVKNINVMREDEAIATDPEPLLANVPVREGDLVVVPVVLEGE